MKTEIEVKDWCFAFKCPNCGRTVMIPRDKTTEWFDGFQGSSYYTTCPYCGVELVL